MKGDFTRDTFNIENHFSRVLMQQGRVTLDADFNEQTAILLHYMRTLARDLIGPYGAPKGDDGGFSLTPILKEKDKKNGLVIGKGHYYVDGILVENTEDCLYIEQPHYVPAEQDLLKVWLNAPKTKAKAKEWFWVYLDVWERHITFIEDDTIREKALSGPDTCTRAQIVWQVKALHLDELNKKLSDRIDLLTKLKGLLETLPANKETQEKIDYYDERIIGYNTTLSDLNKPPSLKTCDKPLDLLRPEQPGSLVVRIKDEKKDNGICDVPPDSKYRRKENQLYRVEIHESGQAGTATFKWSRDNGSVVTRLLNTSQNDIQVSNPYGFAAGNWVELSNDTDEWLNKPGILVKLAKVEGNTLTADALSLPSNWSDQLKHPKVRRWDQVQTADIALADGAVLINKDSKTWIDLEDGIQVQFLPSLAESGGEGVYATGDYWLIPARIATRNIEWPIDKAGAYKAMLPHGIKHHYAPLGVLSAKDQNGKITIVSQPCQCMFLPPITCAE